MNVDKAMEMDKNKDGKIQVYIDTEVIDGIDYIFGLNSGFAYASSSRPYEYIKLHSCFELV